MPRFQYRECIENNVIRRGNNDVSSHILLVLFSIRLTLMCITKFCILLRSRGRRECFKLFKKFASVPQMEENAE